MNKLDINITKASLEGFIVTAADGAAHVTANIALLTEGGKKITSYSVNTNAWDDLKKLQLPVEVMPLLGRAAQLIEAAAVKHCRDEQKGIAATGSDDTPIDLSDIPF